MEPASSGADTYFAPAERSDPRALLLWPRWPDRSSDPAVLEAWRLAHGAGRAPADPCGHRELLDGLKVKTGDNLIGQRPGEALAASTPRPALV